MTPIKEAATPRNLGPSCSPASTPAPVSAACTPAKPAGHAEPVRHRLCSTPARRGAPCSIWRRVGIQRVEMAVSTPWSRIAFVAKILPMPRVSTAFATKTLPLPRAFTAFVTTTPHLPRVFAAFAAKTVSFLAVIRPRRWERRRRRRAAWGTSLPWTSRRGWRVRMWTRPSGTHWHGRATAVSRRSWSHR